MPATAPDLIQHTLNIAITKADDIAQMVYGWASVAFTKNGEQLIDLQGDVLDIDELETAFIEYAKDSRALNFMHNGPQRGTLVELFIATPEKLNKLGLAADALPLGAFVSYHIPNAADYAQAKQDGLLAFSIEGTAIREDIT
jgi:hypothetical protein